MDSPYTETPWIKLSVKNLSAKWVKEEGVSVYGQSVYWVYWSLFNNTESVDQNTPCFQLNHRWWDGVPSTHLFTVCGVEPSGPAVRLPPPTQQQLQASTTLTQPRRVVQTLDTHRLHRKTEPLIITRLTRWQFWSTMLFKNSMKHIGKFVVTALLNWNFFHSISERRLPTSLASPFVVTR